MSVVLSYGTSMKTLRIGRIAGQFAKPRTNLTEQKNNIELIEEYRFDEIISKYNLKDHTILIINQMI